MVWLVKLDSGMLIICTYILNNDMKMKMVNRTLCTCRPYGDGWRPISRALNFRTFGKANYFSSVLSVSTTTLNTPEQLQREPARQSIS